MQWATAQSLLLLLLAGLLAVPFGASAAGVQITEVMYSPQGADNDHEWVEVYNQTENSVDLSSWRLRENETDHRITTDDNPTLKAGSRAVIADDSKAFAEDFPGAPGPVFDSTFSLNNDGETIALVDPADAVADTLTYEPNDDADDTGNSLQLVSGSWRAAEPTPTAANQGDTSAGSQSSDNTNDSDTEETSGGVSKILTPREKTDEEDAEKEASNQSEEIVVNAGSAIQAIAGTQVHLDGTATATDPEFLSDASVRWSLGNGDTVSGADVFYTYEHPGEYRATLMVNGADRQLADQTSVSVSAPKLRVVDTETGESGYIAVANDLNREVDLSGWHLRVRGETTTLPAYTIVPADDRLRVANKATGFTEFGTVELLFPNGEVADTYPETSAQNTQSTTSDRTKAVVDAEGNTASGERVGSGSADTESNTDDAQIPTTDTATGSGETVGTSTNLSALFATNSQSAAVAKSDGGGFWRWASLLALIVAVGAGTVVSLEWYLDKKENQQDLLSDTFDINEM